MRAFGLELRNPLGLAAGFDRTGMLAGRLGFAGFGFVEVGTVAHSHVHVADALRHAPRQAQRIGVNLGSDVDGLHPGVVQEYVAGLSILWEHADYLVANVASPGCPLRAAATNPSAIGDFLAAIRVESSRLAVLTGRRVPLLVKALAAQSAWLDAARAEGFDGAVVVSARADDADLPARVTRLAPLAVVSGGGIRCAAVARARLEAGAVLVQVHTAFAERGALWARRLARDLSGAARSQAHSTART